MLFVKYCLKALFFFINNDPENIMKQRSNNNESRS